MRITCLHTAESNIAVFDSAARELGIEPDVLQHEVRAELLVAAECAGGLTAGISNATKLELLSLAQHADAVVLTCSTLGPSIEDITNNAESPILRADEALASVAAHAASAGGQNRSVVCDRNHNSSHISPFFPCCEGIKSIGRDAACFWSLGIVQVW